MEITPELAKLLELVQGGGNIALVLCAIFIYRASDRLARIEKALDKFISEVSKK